MQFKASVVAIALAATAASAQDLSQIPSCALAASVGALSSTGCATTDIKCVCENKTFLSGLQPVVAKACTDPADLAKALQFAAGLCASVGVSLEIPGPSSAAASASSAASEAVSSLSASVSSVAASASEAVVSASSVEAAISSAYPLPSFTDVVITSAASATPIPSSNGTAVVSPVPSQTVVPGAAANVAVKGGMAVLAAAIGAIFAL